jgi:hypothetical protein
VTIPPRCPAHADQPMTPHPRGWAWLCPVEHDLGLPSPQPVNGAWRPVPLPPPAPEPARRLRLLGGRR